MYVISIKRIAIYFSIIIFAGTISYFIFNNYKNEIVETNANLRTYKIIVDAGHGKPDGGAVSKNGIEESTINLEIAKKLSESLQDEGFEVIMTRNDENNIADIDKQNSIKEMKNSDLSNRVKIANESNADFMISIHMNKFESSKYWGWQTFYSKNSEEGKKLAELVQSSIKNYIDRPNNRTILPIEGIKIVDKTKIPVIIVECGFLSNEEDLMLLQDEDYQDRLVLRDL